MVVPAEGGEIVGWWLPPCDRGVICLAVRSRLGPIRRLNASRLVTTARSTLMAPVSSLSVTRAGAVRDRPTSSWAVAGATSRRPATHSWRLRHPSPVATCARSRSSSSLIGRARAWLTRPSRGRPVPAQRVDRALTDRTGPARHFYTPEPGLRRNPRVGPNTPAHRAALPLRVRLWGEEQSRRRSGRYVHDVGQLGAPVRGGQLPAAGGWKFDAGHRE